MFRNSFTANDKYPVRDCQNLSSLIQMQLSLKSKTFCYFFFFFSFLESISNFKHFEKKDDRQGYFITEFPGCERLV